MLTEKKALTGVTLKNKTKKSKNYTKSKKGQSKKVQSKNNFKGLFRIFNKKK